MTGTRKGLARFFAREQGMLPEDHLILACARQEFSEHHLATILELCGQEPIRWAEVFFTASQHGIAPLVYRNLFRAMAEGVAVPPEVAGMFEIEVRRNRAVKQSMGWAIERLLDHFGRRGVAVLLIKGAAADVLVYEQPWYTASFDLDLVLKTPKGTVTDAEIDAVLGHRGFTIEWECGTHHDVLANGALPVDFDRVWADAARIDYRGREAWVMSPEDALITSCISSSRKRFHRLKPLCDTAEILARNPDLNWASLCDKARAYDCQAMAYTGLLMAGLRLGSHVPDQAMAALDLSAPRRAVLRYWCRRGAAIPLASYCSGPTVLGVKLNWSVVLPYLSLRPYQVWRKVRFAASTAFTLRSRITS